ncbi:MAG: TetR/AcrR family transcriptional regulator [Clostridiales Family XIII bacterium]|jgi:AcrR family transcriptional regulator|nr:TetR/AcrR family transcriptional regulator [Clostridiales Family XIII bacterium]
MRVVKEGKERRNEILDAAGALFASKGYDKATVNDILDAVKIGKGTFYYYFKSKEEVLDAIISRRGDEGIAAAEKIAATPALTAQEKLLKVILAQKPDTESRKQLIEVLHEVNNTQMHQKILVDMTLRLSPILAGVALQGIQEGVFDTPFPLESVELLLVSAQTIFDDANFRWTQEEMATRVKAFLCAMERVLGAKAGSLSAMAQVF